MELQQVVVFTVIHIPSRKICTHKRPFLKWCISIKNLAFKRSDFLSRPSVLTLIFRVFLQSCCGLFASTQPESKPRSGPWEFGMRLLRTRVSKVTKAITYPQSSRSCYFSILISSISWITHMIGSALFAALRIYLTTWFPNKFCLSLAFAKVKSIFSRGGWIQFAFFYFSFSDWLIWPLTPTEGP